MTKHKHRNGPARKPKKQSVFESPMTPTAPQEAEMGEQSESGTNDKENVTKELARQFKWVEFAQIASNVGLFIVGIVALCIYNGQLDQMRSSTKAAKDAVDVANATLKVSQRAYITVGRKDGVIADFVVAKNPKEPAEVVIYFQNSGHLPAKFIWGLMPGAMLTKGSKKQSSGLMIAQNFKPLPFRTRDKKTGSIGEDGGAITIGGDSVLAATLGIISQKDLAELPAYDMGLVLMGQYDYCDELGTRSLRMFSIQYRSHAPSGPLSFRLLYDGPGGFFLLPKDTDTTEYLPPCETTTERERNSHQLGNQP